MIVYTIIISNARRLEKESHPSLLSRRTIAYGANYLVFFNPRLVARVPLVARRLQRRMCFHVFQALVFGQEKCQIKRVLVFLFRYQAPNAGEPYRLRQQLLVVYTVSFFSFVGHHQVIACLPP